MGWVLNFKTHIKNGLAWPNPFSSSPSRVNPYGPGQPVLTTLHACGVTASSKLSICLRRSRSTPPLGQHSGKQHIYSDPSNDMSDFLDNELWLEIFIRLPMKSIIRCSIVCKSWKSMIKGQEFITWHLNTKIENQAHSSCLLVHNYCKSRKERFEFYNENNFPMNMLSELNPPFEAQNKYFDIVGTCNGLVCLSDNLQQCPDNVIVWNPLVGKSTCLPRRRYSCFSCEFTYHVLGFGYDTVRKDYKVVSIVHMDNIDNRVEIFRLSTGKWRNISRRALGHFNYLTNDGQAYLNGSVHWIGNVNDTLNNVAIRREMIVSFDMCKERFRKLELPEVFATYPSYFIEVAVYKGLLAIVEDNGTKFTIWTMTDYGSSESWNQHICLHDCSWVRSHCGFMKNGDILSLENIWNYLSSYNPITGQGNFLKEYTSGVVFFDKGDDFSDTATAEKVIAANERKNWRMLRVYNNWTNPGPSSMVAKGATRRLAGAKENLVPRQRLIRTRRRLIGARRGLIRIRWRLTRGSRPAPST